MDAHETRARDEAVTRLQHRFPSVPSETIEHQVDELFHRFEGSRVRRYVGLLVEREATQALRKPHGV